MSGTRAIFVSYASEDADAAQRICEALLDAAGDVAALVARCAGCTALPPVARRSG
jgi:hypothetical protein